MLNNTVSQHEIELVNYIFEFGSIKVDDVIQTDAARSLIDSDVIYEVDDSDGNIYKFTDSMKQSLLAGSVKYY